MPRIIFYELKKLFSLPVAVLWAAAVVILAAAMVGRYTSLTGQAGMGAAGLRTVSMEYAGPLDQALADRALRDWRALLEIQSDRDPPETQARRQVLQTLEDEFTAAGGVQGTKIPAGVSADATARLEPLLEARYAPFIHGYWEGWGALLAAYNGEAAWLCAVMVAFGLSALFSGEGAAIMAACVRTTRHGKGTLALGKWVAAAAYALLCAALCLGLPLAMGAMLFGLQGGELPVQYAGSLDNPIAYPLTLAQYAGLRAAMAAMGALALAGCTAAFSAAMPSVTTPVAAALALFAAPMVLQQIKLTNPVLDTVLRYLPSKLLLAQPGMKTMQVAQLWGGVLWQPAWLCIFWAAALLLLGGFATRQWLRVRREEPISQD